MLILTAYLIPTRYSTSNTCKRYCNTTATNTAVPTATPTATPTVIVCNRRTTQQPCLFQAGSGGGACIRDATAAVKGTLPTHRQLSDSFRRHAWSRTTKNVQGKNPSSLLELCIVGCSNRQDLLALPSIDRIREGSGMARWPGYPCQINLHHTYDTKTHQHTKELRRKINRNKVISYVSHVRTRKNKKEKDRDEEKYN